MNISDNFYKKYNNLFLNDFQIAVLKKHGINLSKFRDNQELVFYLEYLLNYDYDEELDNVSLTLSELNYYNNVNK